MHTHMLIHHHEIRIWAANHHGTPAIRRGHNRFGQPESRLALTFVTPKAAPEAGMPQVDDGLSPVSWTAWLAELDRRQLALRVSDRANPDFEFVVRRDVN